MTNSTRNAGRTPRHAGRQEERCSATTKAGQRCRQVLNLRRAGRRFYCAVHDPERRRDNLETLQRATAASLRSRTRGNENLLAEWPLDGGRLPATAADALLLAGWTTKQLVGGRISWRIAHELVQACNAVAKTYNVVYLAERLKQAEELIARLVAHAKRRPGEVLTEEGAQT